MKQTHYTHSIVMAGTLIITALFSSCAKYTPHNFHQPIGVRQEQQRVTLVASALDENDCKYYFSRKVIAKGYQPIQLMIRNDSDKTYVLDGQSIDLQLVDKSFIAKELHLDVAHRVISWGIAGLFLWPFIIPAAVEGVKATSANKRLSIDFNDRAIDNDSYITLAPRMALNKVMFVRYENFAPEFTVTLNDKYSKDSLNFFVEVAGK